MPQFPVRPYFRGPDLIFEIKFGPEWWDGPLTYPATEYGMKFAVGKYIYHNGGTSFGFINRDGKMYVIPRYYEPIQSGTYKPHELDQYKVEIDQNWHKGILTTKGLQWWWDGLLIHTVPTVTVPHCWYASPFIGRSGRDTGYNINNPPAYAARDLTIEIKI